MVSFVYWRNSEKLNHLFLGAKNAAGTVKDATGKAFDQTKNAGEKGK